MKLMADIENKKFNCWHRNDGTKRVSTILVEADNREDAEVIYQQIREEFGKKYF